MTLSLFMPASQAKPELPSIADEVMAKAEAAIDRLAAEYPRHAGRDVADLDRHAEKMDSDRDNRKAHYDEILRIAHDMRGQGALFGYPLMTRYAGSLCKATRLLEAHDYAILNIVRTHVMAMQAILGTRVMGAGDRSALAVAVGLEMLVSTRTSR
ncbi:MAG: hypothetical protein IMF08_18820 [Proteobacteria bacterium]|nr:hypothetical protein [Pseudomonadota bacterium]